MRWLAPAFFFLLLLACGDPDREDHDAVPMEYDAGGAGGQPSYRCDDGDTKKCRIKIGDHEGVVTCVDGLRTCEDGAWGPCEAYDGEAGDS